MSIVDAYLDRIGYAGPREPSSQLLRDLHRDHLLTVPFENLDISLGCKIVCDEARFLNKIVERRRGGFCYELNGAFAALLRSLGFNVTMLSARVAREDGSQSPEFDHLTLRVDLEEPWLADVGFGDCFLEPLRLQPELVQTQYGGTFRVTQQNNAMRVEKMTSGDWKHEYSLTLLPRKLEEFAAMCHYHQTSPESPFTQKRLCSLATQDGRITISDRRVIVTRKGIKEERILASEAEWQQALKGYFGIRL